MSVLEKVVHLGGLALEVEDRLIEAALACREEKGGLARIENERYHQFIIWRAILPVWETVLERENSSDLIVRRGPDDFHYFELTHQSIIKATN